MRAMKRGESAKSEVSNVCKSRKNRSIAKSRRPAGDSCVDCASALRVEKGGGRWKKKNICEIARGDYSIKSGVIRSRNRGETKITTSN